MPALLEDEAMVLTHEHRNPTRQATSPAGGARALAILLVLAAFLLAPFIATMGKPQNAAIPHNTQIVSNQSKANTGCPKKSLPGQPNACTSSSAPVAGLGDRGVAPAPVAQRSIIRPHYHVTLATQCCGAPPDRPPRFAA